VVDRFARVASVDVGLLDEVAVAALLGDVAGLVRFLQAREIDLNQRLRQLAAQCPGVDPTAINARDGPVGWRRGAGAGTCRAGCARARGEGVDGRGAVVG
jgi:hypothetical protein